MTIIDRNIKCRFIEAVNAGGREPFYSTLKSICQHFISAIKMLSCSGIVPLGQPIRQTSIKKELLKKNLLAILFCMFAGAAWSQKVDSIYFHLYTDSLKKGTHNYINVDGKLSNGNWLPLTDKQIEFSASACDFSGNELIIPANFNGEKITVKAVLKANPATWIERTIWIKKKADPELLTSKEEVIKETKSKRKRN